MTLKQALWEIVRDENIIITNQNIDWLLDRASKKATGDAQALKESILERKRVIEENIPCALTNEEKVSEIVRCKECKHNVANWQHDELDGTDYTDIVCDYFMTDGMDKNDFCSRGEKLLINENKSNNFDVKSNEELFKQALVEGLNRHFDREIEEAKKIEQIEEMAKAIHEVENLEWLEDTLAEALYNAGYRKQSEGEWKDRYNGKYANAIYECSLCKEKALWKIGINELGSPKITQLLSPFCPHCGAKMKGGEE